MKSSHGAFFISLCLHFLGLAFLVVNLKPAPATQSAAPSETNLEPMHALAINAAEVEQQLKAIKQAENRKQRLEAERIKQLEQKAQAAAEQTAREKRALAQVVEAQHQQALIQAQATAKTKQALRKLQREQAAAQAELAKLKHQEAADAVEKKLRAEENALFAKQMQEEQQQLAAARQHQELSEIEKYTALITHAIGRHWIQPETLAHDVSCVLLIKLAPNGEVLEVQLITSSGDNVLDRSATAAVHKASPLPVPESPELFAKFREIRLKVKPEGYLL